MLREIPITLDLSKVGDQKTITGIRQNDTDTIKFVITLVNGSSPFNLDLSSCAAIMFGVKPDGKIICNYASIQYAQNRVVYTLNAQDTAAAGVVKWQLIINEAPNGTRRTLASPQFSSVVEPATVPSESLESDNVYQALLDTIATANYSMLSRYSFLTDSDGVIFDVTSDTEITSSSFGNYNEDMTQDDYIVWLAASVTSVSDTAFPQYENITHIYWEADEESVEMPSVYSLIPVTYGVNKLRDLYALKSLAYLLEKKLEKVTFSDLDTNLQTAYATTYLTQISISDVASLNGLAYLVINNRFGVTLTGSAAESFGVSSGTLGHLYNYGTTNSIANDGTYHRVMTFPGSAGKWVQTVTVSSGSMTFTSWSRAKTSVYDLDSELQTAYATTYLNQSSVSDVATLNLFRYLTINNTYGITLTGDAAAFFGVLSGTFGYLYNYGTTNSINSDGNYYRVLTFPDSSIKWVQTVTVSSGSRNFGSWNKISISVNELDATLMAAYNTTYLRQISISDVATLNGIAYLEINNKYGVTLTGSAATSFGVSSGTLGHLYNYGTANSISNDGTYYRVMTFPGSVVKWVQTVTVSSGSRTLGEWEEIEPTLGTVNYSDLDTELKIFVDHGLGIYKETLAITNKSDLNIYVDVNKRRHIKLSGNAASDFGVADNSIAELVCVSVGAAIYRYIIFPEYATKWVQIVTVTTSNGQTRYSYGLWTRVRINLDDLKYDLQDRVYYATRLYVNTVTDLSSLDNITYCDVRKRYNLKLTSLAASTLGVESGTVAEMYTLLGVDEMYRYIVFPNNHIKLKQTITGPVEGVYTFGTWETLKVEADDLNAEIKAKVQSALTITGTDVFLTLAAMDSPVYIDNMYKRRIIKLSGTAASDLGVENNTYAEMYSLLVATKTWKRFIIILGSNIKFEQDITKSNSDVYSFSEWERAQSVTVDIGDGAITRDKLSAAGKNIYDKSLLIENIQTISTVSTLNGSDFLSIRTEYPIKLTGSAAAAFEVDSDTYATVRIVPKATMIDPSSWSVLQVIEFPEIEGVTWVQNVATVNSVTSYLGWEKAYTPSAKTVTSGSTVALEDNTEYAGTNINSLTLTYPDGEFECYLTLSFASSGTITVTFPSSSYIGTVPEFDNDETWEISIKNGVVVAAKAVSYEEET